MVLHLLIVDDEEDVLDSPVPGFVRDLAEGLARSREFQAANLKAGSPFPVDRPLNIKVSAVGYESRRLAKYKHHAPAHLHLHLCCVCTRCARVCSEIRLQNNLHRFQLSHQAPLSENAPAK